MSKIAFLVEIINNQSGARAPLELAKQLSKLNHQITVYGYKDKLDRFSYDQLLKSKIKVILLEKSKSSLLSKFLPNLNLLRSLKQNRFDLVIFAGTLPFFLSAKLSGIPIIRIYMGSQFDAYLEKKLPDQKISLSDRVINRIGNFYIFINELLMTRLSDYVVAISKYCTKELKKYYKRTAERTIYLGGDHLPYIKNKLRTSNKLKLLSISRLTPYKNFHLIIEAISKLKDPLKLTIVGNSHNPDYLKYLKNIAPKNVHFTQNCSDNQLAKLYSESDLYITADRFLFFGFPIAEAAFFAIPSIAFNFAAAGELIDNKRTGFLISNQDHLLNLLTELLQNPDQIKKLGQAAKNRAKDKFAWSKIALEYQNLIKTIYEKG